MRGAVPSTITPVKRARIGCLFAFGLPFVAIGIYGAVAAWRLYSVAGGTRAVMVLAGVAFAFLFVGIGMMSTALWGHRRELTDETLRAAHPDQPWMWNADWVSRRLTDQSRAGTALLWGFALLWTAIASPALLFVPDAIRKGHLLAWFGLLFPLVGIVLLANATRLTLRALRFRESTLVLDTVPVPIGGTLRGNLEVPHALTSVSGVMIRLVGMERRQSGRDTTSRIVCHEERELEAGLVRHTADGTIIPIEIAVPADVPATDPTNEQLQMLWRLNVDAEVPGIDYRATFDVPIFKTEFSDFRPHGAAPAITAPLNPTSFIERHMPEGRELHFSRFRAPSRAIVSLLFTALWLGVIAFLVVAGAPIVIPIVCGLIAIPLLIATLEHFFESHTIRLGPHAVTVTRRLLSKTENEIPYADIVRAHATTGATLGGARPYYRVDIETTAGKRIQAAKNIQSKREADWIASRIKPRS